MVPNQGSNPARREHHYRRRLAGDEEFGANIGVAADAAGGLSFRARQSSPCRASQDNSSAKGDVLLRMHRGPCPAESRFCTESAFQQVWTRSPFKSCDSNAVRPLPRRVVPETA